MARSLLLAFCFLSPVVFADAIDEIAGGYPLYAIDGNANYSGVVEISSGEKGVGFKLSELQGPEGQAFITEIFTPKAESTVKKEGAVVIQEFRSDALNVRIEYERKDERLQINASQCRKNELCQLLLINTDMTIGDEVSARDFFTSLKGKYTITKVGPGEPHGPKIADISVSDEEANLTFPYCADSGGACDPGYIDLTLADLKVFKKSVARGHVLATVLYDGKRFTWEERVERIFFRNYQYETFTGEKLVLTHELKR